ncbi:MAG: transcriptional repressor LexA [bacterium]|nr:transcriptional repressor LexA [bacterium]
MDQELTPKQREILAFIKRELQEKGYPPSVREICRAVGLRSPSTVHGYLTGLEERGLVRREAAKPRAMEVLEPRQRMVAVPLVGRVTAGRPILAEENLEETYSLPFDLVRAEDVFMLRVRGDSMEGAGIADGDHVLVRRQSTAENGDIVVALLEDEATVKRFYRERDHFRLQPENPAHRPLLVSDVAILGKVIGLIRRL